jgi:hypothetical protein
VIQFAARAASKAHAAFHNVRRSQLQNNDPKSENKALKERAAKTKDVEGRLKGMAREHMRSREKVLGGSRPRVDKAAR